ncbi:MAG: three-Cys-motif partner protein TcmP [Pirellulales bacterium]
MSDDLYEGREQSLIKHLILRRYLQRFAFIIGSHWNSITYVDCFSGPWNSRSNEFADTSFGIALGELRSARDALLQNQGRQVKLRCFFLEKSPPAYDQLRKFLDRIDDVEIETRNATLEDSVDEIVAFTRHDRPQSFPFVFIDPTGWTGFALDVIRPLLALNPGEVLVNFMTGHIRRFIEAPDAETQQSFNRLFGSTRFRDDLKGLEGRNRDDAAVFRYMSTVKQAGGYAHASPAVVLHPEKNRSHFHLIYLTRSPKGIEVFKDAERKAMRAMTDARARAQQLQRQRQSGGQKELFTAEELHDPTYFDELRNRYLDLAMKRVLLAMEAKRRISYDELWAIALSVPLVWEADLKAWIIAWAATKKLTIEGMKPRQRVPKRKEGIFIARKNAESS